MGFFDDDVYQNLDWLSQATTPLVFSGNTILGKMPDKVIVSSDLICKSLSQYGGLGISSFVSDMLPHGHEIEYYVRDLLASCYSFTGEGNMLIDTARGIFPAIQVVKIKQSFSEKEIIAYIQHKLRYGSGSGDVNRMNEILDLIDYKPENDEPNARTSRSFNKKTHGILTTLNKIFASNKWQVRDADLMVSFIDWVGQYILHGNLAALTNITKLKIMTHKKQPIYSIKEAK